MPTPSSARAVSNRSATSCSSSGVQSPTSLLLILSRGSPQVITVRTAIGASNESVYAKPPSFDNLVDSGPPPGPADPWRDHASQFPPSVQRQPDAHGGRHDGRPRRHGGLPGAQPRQSRRPGQRGGAGLRPGHHEAGPGPADGHHDPQPGPQGEPGGPGAHHPVPGPVPPGAGQAGAGAGGAPRGGGDRRRDQGGPGGQAAPDRVRGRERPAAAHGRDQRDAAGTRHEPQGDGERHRRRPGGPEAPGPGRRPGARGRRVAGRGEPGAQREDQLRGGHPGPGPGPGAGPGERPSWRPS